jgi:hypothetical protein
MADDSSCIIPGAADDADFGLAHSLLEKQTTLSVELLALVAEAEKWRGWSTQPSWLDSAPSWKCDLPQ